MLAEARLKKFVSKPWRALSLRGHGAKHHLWIRSLELEMHRIQRYLRSIDELPVLSEHFGSLVYATFGI